MAVSAAAAAAAVESCKRRVLASIDGNAGAAEPAANKPNKPSRTRRYFAHPRHADGPLQPPSCPQLIHPDIDTMAYLLLGRLRVGTFARVGVNVARAMVCSDAKPLTLVVAAQVPHYMSPHAIDELRGLAALHGVPVVHAMSPHWISRACNTSKPAGAVAIMGVPDTRAERMLAALMCKAADACEGYLRAVEAADAEAAEAAAAEVEVEVEDAEVDAAAEDADENVPRAAVAAPARALVHAPGPGALASASASAAEAAAAARRAVRRAAWTLNRA